MDLTTCDDETAIAKHETVAMMAVHLPRIQNFDLSKAPTYDLLEGRETIP
jgi:hypothetical protein